ncbi:MAG: tRNA guanosine(15) transglycosylase TgtA [Candidatus Thorarchaeota archaeon]|nr:tRNA guanosine(15) transglycosylase TgtA [Candidatus Thorarchaeota archaeon]
MSSNRTRMAQFEIRAKDGLARLGRFTTKHGTVKTPLLMPVVHPGKSVIRPRALVDEFGFQMVITNSYIINSHERFRDKALSEGVHALLDFDGPIMTDSGTFQMYFHNLPEKEIDPVEIVEFQRDIGADIGTILDVFSDLNVSRSKVEEDVQKSLERAKVSIDKRGEMFLAGTVQGGVYPDLRETAAKALGAMDFDVHPIGGVVPIMERYRYADIVRITLAAKKHLPPDRPVHLFGCGHPMLFAQAALLGCDFFDSASYAKFAESGRMLLPSGTVHLKDLTELPCSCPICSTTSADELKSEKNDERALQLMKHNLYVSSAEMRRVRQAISQGKLFELAAYRARGHPTLYEALQVMAEEYLQLEKEDPIGKTTSIFYTGPETTKRPEITGFHSRLITRYPYKHTNTILLVSDPGLRPFFDTSEVIIREVRKRVADDLVLLFVTPMGVVPWELEHVHPAQQCLFPESLDSATLDAVSERTRRILESMKYQKVIWFKRETNVDSALTKLSDDYSFDIASSATEAINHLPPESDESSWTRRKLRALLTYQWGANAGGLADLEDLQIVLSKNTGKIRHCKSNDEILFTVVPTTGLLTPTYRGGQELLRVGLDDIYKVTMDSDVSEFVASGKSALAKFVKHADPSLKAGEEVLVLDEVQNLLGTGRALISGDEMTTFKRGVAVVIRHPRKH